MKILILLLYCERPVMVRNALNSIKKADMFWSDWHCAFLDDSCVKFGDSALNELLGSYKDKITYYRTNRRPHLMSDVGKYMNQAIEQSDADIALMLCDDDELHPKYLLLLNDYFTKNKKEFAVYCHLYYYNPSFERSELSVDKNRNSHNRFTKRVINAATRLDASQVAWRTECNKKYGVWFSHPKTRNLDSAFYNGLASLGTIDFLGVVGQYKGIHSVQLAKMYGSVTDILTGKVGIDIEDCIRLTPREQVIAIARGYYNSNPKEALRICQVAGINPKELGYIVQ